MDFKATVIFLFVVAASVAAPVPATDGLYYTSSCFETPTDVLSVFEFFLTHLPGYNTVSSQKRSESVADTDSGNVQNQDNDDTNNDTLVLLTAVNLLLGSIILISISWLAWRTFFRDGTQPRCRRSNNAERVRAQQVLVGHPLPLDTELGVIHARSPDNQWPLVDSTEGPAAPPNSPVYYGMMNDDGQTNISEISLLSANTIEPDVADARIPEIFITDTDIQEVLVADIDEPEPEYGSTSTDGRHIETESEEGSTGEAQEQYPSCVVLETGCRKTPTTRINEQLEPFWSADVHTIDADGYDTPSKDTRAVTTPTSETSVPEAAADNVYAQNGINIIDFAYCTMEPDPHVLS
jgi:hypothetical protein